jgi:hypothetical protein
LPAARAVPATLNNAKAITSFFIGHIPWSNQK